jgi:hypothetical protein
MSAQPVMTILVPGGLEGCHPATDQVIESGGLILATYGNVTNKRQGSLEAALSVLS